MVIVAGHVSVKPGRREANLAVSARVGQARGAAGCLDVAISADLLDPGRVNIIERWESQAALESFRRTAPSDEQGAARRAAPVAEYDFANVRFLFEEGPS